LRFGKFFVTRSRLYCMRLPGSRYNKEMQRKIFWTVFIALGLIADFTLPLLWGLLATIPIGVVSWWVAYRSDWF
jgi:hypothetical protein